MLNVGQLCLKTGFLKSYRRQHPLHATVLGSKTNINCDKTWRCQAHLSLLCWLNPPKTEWIHHFVISQLAPTVWNSLLE